MKYLRIAYDTIWFRVHPVWQDAEGRPLYPSWRASFETARILAS